MAVSCNITPEGASAFQPLDLRCECVLPAGDVNLWQWMTNWMRYQASHKLPTGLWRKWVSDPVRTQFHIPTTVVGQYGEPITEG